MAITFESGVQYGDYKGNVSIDGFTGPSLHELCREKKVLPSGYFPVGAELYMDNTFQREQDKLFSCTVFAVDSDQIGHSAEEIGNLAKRDGHLRVFSFPCELTEAEVRQYFKRVSIAFMDRWLDEIPGFELQVVEGPEAS